MDLFASEMFTVGQREFTCDATCTVVPCSNRS